MHPDQISSSLASIVALATERKLRFNQAVLLAFATQLTTLIGGFGIVDNTTVGIVSNASVAVINTAFLIAAAVSELAHHRTVAAATQAHATVQAAQVAAGHSLAPAKAVSPSESPPAS